MLLNVRTTYVRSRARLQHNRPRAKRFCPRCLPTHEETSWNIGIRDGHIEVDVQKAGVQLECPVGRLHVVHLHAEDIKPASIMVTRSFADSNWQSIDDIQSYLQDSINESPASVVLVARLYPTETSTFFVPQGREYRVVGLATLSFSEESRDEFATEGEPDLPKNSIYLSNMSVDTKLRRCGIGKGIVTVCETVSQQVATQRTSLSLHVDAKNEGAIAFYSSLGFSVTAEDARWKAFRGQRRLKVMAKPL